jgi:tetraacyldisaccharide 4'-kinase
LNQQCFHKLISGQPQCFGAVVLRIFLGGAAKLYAAVISLRNFAYSKGWLKIYKANVPVISIGNITTGGTGKTPLVIWLCNHLTKNYNCTILTRGYKATQNYSDESVILTETCPNAKVIVNPNRVVAARQAVDKFGANVLIMDDGFQHRCLARNLDIITIDATCPFGYGKMLPAGLLREPAAALKRADAAVITRCNQTSENELAELEKKLHH